MDGVVIMVEVAATEELVATAAEVRLGAGEAVEMEVAESGRGGDRSGLMMKVH